MADISSLFGSIGNSSNTNSTFSLADYASIRNGSYGKLLRAYYTKQEKEASSKAETSAAESKNLALIKTDSDSLKKTMLDLMDEDLYEKKEIKDKDGNVTKDYDREAIAKSVKAFVDGYNSVIDAVGKSEDKAVLRNGVWLTGVTKANEDLLNKIGITIGSGNKLSLDENRLKDAHISTLSSIFTGYNSYGDDVLRKAAQLSTAATQGASRSGTTYNNNADYEKLISSGLIYDKES